MKQELIVAQRASPIAKIERANVMLNVPGVYTGGPVESMLFKWRAERHTKAINALTAQNVAESSRSSALAYESVSVLPRGQ